MKKSFFFLGLILLAGFGSSFGQPFSIIDKLTSPQSTIACPAPVHTSYGHTLGFFPTIPVHDTIIVKCYFGDGTDTTQNQIVSIYDSTNLYLFNYPHIYSTPGMYVRNFSARSISTGILDSTFIPDTLYVGTSCDTIKGYLYKDINADCMPNTGDSVLFNSNNVPNNVFKHYFNNSIVNPNNIHINTVSNRFYIPICYGVPGTTEQYIVKFTDPNFANACCVPNAQYSYSSFPINTQADFGFSCMHDCLDLALYFSSISAGINQAILDIIIINFGCFNSGVYTAKVIIDPMYHYSYTLPGSFSPTIIPAASGDTLKYALPGLSFLDNQYFKIRLLPNTVTLDAYASFKCLVEANADCIPSNNFCQDSSKVFAAIDPNDKQVTPDGNIYNMTELTYNVRFQNTGNAAASSVTIIDTLDSHLDMNTFHFIASSHDVFIEKLPGNIVHFNYDPISLPDSGADYLGSMGAVKFSIKPLGYYPIGTEIKNTAYIYFDDNAAVVTNTVVNTIDTTVHEQIELIQNNNSFTIYPNPATNTLHIQLPQDNSTAELKIYNLLGQIQQTLRLTKQETAINISALSKGAYIIEVATEKSVGRGKFVKE